MKGRLDKWFPLICSFVFLACIIKQDIQARYLTIRIAELEQYGAKAQMACAYSENLDRELELALLELDKIGSWANGQYHGIRYRPYNPVPEDHTRAVKYALPKRKARAPKGYEELAK